MSDSKKLAITQWAEEDRPREKLLNNGASALTIAELIAILLGSGNDNESAVDLAKRMLQEYSNDLSVFYKISIGELRKFKGIGEAKAVTIAASIELARRYNAARNGKTPDAIKSSIDAYRVIAPNLLDIRHEEFWVICLSQSNHVISKYRISQGGISATTVDIRLIFNKALVDNAISIVICHNHPSGNEAISQSDRVITERIKNAGNILNIKLLDHIVVTGNLYVSFLDENIL